MTAKVWDEGHYVIEKQYWSGTKKLNGTLDNAAAADNTDGDTRIPITGHGMVAGNQIQIAGSVAYNGIWTIVSVAANYIVIDTAYVAETFAGTETYVTCFRNDPYYQDIQLIEVRLSLTGGAGAAEAFTIAVDSNNGAAWDFTIYSTSVAFTRLTHAPEERKYLDGQDIVQFSYTNTNNRTWGLELVYRRQA
jgi:hypothetical protein